MRAFGETGFGFAILPHGAAAENEEEEPASSGSQFHKAMAKPLAPRPNE